MRNFRQTHITAFEGTLTRDHTLVAYQPLMPSGIIQVSNERAPQLSRWMKKMNFKKFVRIIVQILPPLSAGLIVSVFAALVTDLFLDSNGKTTYDKLLFIYLDSGLKEGRFDQEYLEIGFSHYDRNSGGLLSKNGYVETLEDYIVYLETNNSSEKKDWKLKRYTVSLVRRKN